MRTYIYTELERRAIKRFLSGDIGANDPTIMVVKSRMGSFRRLSEDIALYEQMWSAFTKSETT
jgi:hypothetical protein